MLIGIPKEIMKDERRVSATPETVALMVKDGLTVWVQSSAGEGSFYHDEQYVEAGAQMVEDPSEIFAKADVILKVKEPQFHAGKNLHEVDMLREGQYLITFLHPASPGNHEMIRNLAAKGVIGLTLDGIPRITRAQKMDALTSMSTCAGYKGLLMAADMLPKFAPQVFCPVGMIKPINVFVVGVGVAGLQSLATAKRLGAIVSAADIRPEAEEQAISLGSKLVKTGVPEEVALGGGGYAQGLSEEWLEKERSALSESIIESDISVLAALVPNRMAPILVAEETVKKMKPGSVLVDISIDQGGNCGLTEAGKTVVKHGVTIIGIKNIPGLLPHSSTWLFSKNMYQLLKYLVKDGKIELNASDEIVEGILTTRDGKVVHAGALEAMK